MIISLRTASSTSATTRSSRVTVLHFISFLLASNLNLLLSEELILNFANRLEEYIYLLENNLSILSQVPIE